MNFSSFFLLFLFFFATSVHCCCSSSTPIVLVPGLLGSQIEAKLDKPSVVHFFCLKYSNWFTLWLDLEIALFDSCFVDNAKLLYDTKIQQYHNNYGVYTKIPGFGGTDTIEFLDSGNTIPYFHELVELFKEHGYVPGVNIRSAPYDWRYGIDGQLKNSYFKALKLLIEETYSRNNQTQITLIAHSLGGYISHYFLAHYVSNEWKQVYVKRFISLSGVFGGTVKSLGALVSGIHEIPGFGSAKLITELARTLPSAVSLLPYTSLWGQNETLISTPSYKYTVNDIHKIFKDIGYENGTRMYSQLQNVTNDFSPPNVTHYCFYGTHVPTIESVAYSDDFADVKPAHGDGDGTVNYRSLKSCQLWQAKQPAFKVYLKEFQGVDHFQIISKKDVLKDIKDIIIADKN